MGAGITLRLLDVHLREGLMDSHFHKEDSRISFISKCPFNWRLTLFNDEYESMGFQWVESGGRESTTEQSLGGNATEPRSCDASFN